MLARVLQVAVLTQSFCHGGFSHPLSISCRNDFRLCREPSHIPLRCNEVERQGETSMRAYIENKMSEAMLRQCHKCKKRFYKTEGCNSMRCTCGAMMCYVCRKPIKSYDHFRRRYASQCLYSSVPYKVIFRMQGMIV